MAETKCNRCGQTIIFAGQDDQGKWIINNPDGTRHVDQQRPGGGGSRPMRTPGELHDIRREACLNAAVAWCSAKLTAGGDIDTKEVLIIARAFVAYVEEGRPA